MTAHLDQFAGMLTERDQQVLAASGHGQPVGLRAPCALLVIDMTYDFIGDRPQHILESVKRFPQSCGAAGWKAADHLVGLLDAARQHRVPVVYTVRSAVHRRLEQVTFGRKRRSPSGPAQQSPDDSNQVPTLIKPQPDDIVIAKSKPSAFFGTPLIEYLVALDVRQLICCGATTSGCVRATVVDGFSYGFNVAVVEECTADRWEISHAVAMFDMASKYADLVSVGTAIEHITGSSSVSGS